MAHVCKRCSKDESNNFYPETANRLEKNQLCFGCDFWITRVEEVKADKHWCSIGGTLYYENGMKKDSKHNGHGGRKFKIKFFDGREIETNDLWCSGQIPDSFKSQLPDNAEFVKAEEKLIEHGEGFYKSPF